MTTERELSIEHRLTRLEQGVGVVLLLQVAQLPGLSGMLHRLATAFLGM